MLLSVNNHEEFEAVTKMLNEMREKKARELAESQAKAEFEMAVSNLITAVGTATAKRILREINHKLRYDLP